MARFVLFSEDRLRLETMRALWLATYTFLCMYLIGCYKLDVVYDAEPDHNYELPLILKMNGKDCAFDADRNVLRFSLFNLQGAKFEPFVEFQPYSSVKFENVELTNHQINDLGVIEPYKPYALRITTEQYVQNLTLIFTCFPIVQVITPNQIMDEPKDLARIRVHYPEFSEPSFTSYIGIEIRGASSQSLPKKSYGFTCKLSQNIKEEFAVSFFGRPKNYDWILDGMYNDHSRQRAGTSFEIWRSLDGANHYGTSSSLVEMYINNTHYGVYSFNEAVNSEMLGLTDFSARLYKAISWGNTEFYNYDYSFPYGNLWGGWEQKFPDSDLGIDWQPLVQLSWLVVEADSIQFVDEISGKLDIENIIDYYLFLNLMSAYDNTGKNIFLTRRHGNDPFKIVPWDLDATWGLFWDGTAIGSTGVLTNGLFDRLIVLNHDGFRSKLKARWVTLRGGVYSETNLRNVFQEKFEMYYQSDLVSLENDIWGQNIDMESEQQELLGWIEDRLDFLDEYYASL